MSYTRACAREPHPFCSSRSRETTRANNELCILYSSPTKILLANLGHCAGKKAVSCKKIKFVDRLEEEEEEEKEEEKEVEVSGFIMLGLNGPVGTIPT